MSSSAITHLVSFLTRPLMRSYAPTTIVSLQVYLCTALSSSPQTLVLSAKCLPPPVLQRACVVSGIAWAEWIQSLSSGIDLKIFVTESSLAVKLGTMPRRMLWVARENAVDKPKPTLAPAFRFPSVMAARTPSSARPRTTSVSARARNDKSAALNPTRIPTLLSSSYTVEDIAFECDSDSESDTDSDSDISDSGFSSTSSVTSVSTTSSCAFSSIVRPTPAAKADAKRYLYQGGVTQVVGGGVMLGVVPKPRLSGLFSRGKARPSGIPHNAVRKTAASTADSWRRSA